MNHWKSWHAQRGITLPELLLALAVVALLSLLSVPLTDAYTRSLQTQRLFELQRLLNLARSRAVTQRQRVTLCGSSDRRHCSNHWTPASSVLVFIDRDRNRRLDATDRLLQENDTLGGHWHWRASGLRHYMRYGRRGQALDFGSFYLCPERGEADIVRRVRVNAPGRSYRDRIGLAEARARGLCRQRNP